MVRVYLAHHLEACVEQLLGSFVVDGLWSIVHHGVVTHQLKVSLVGGGDKQQIIGFVQVQIT